MERKNNYMCSTMSFVWTAMALTLFSIGQKWLGVAAMALGVVFVFAFERPK